MQADGQSGRGGLQAREMCRESFQAERGEIESVVQEANCRCKKLKFVSLHSFA